MDLLVKLYDLPKKSTAILPSGMMMRKALPPEKHIVVNWVKKNFNDHWASEADRAFMNNPVTCLLAVKENNILGFACYEATCKGFFGPTGVLESERGQGLGKALLIASLYGLADLGYAYGIIGGVGPKEFYEKTVNAIPIAGSTPGIYNGMLK